MIKNENHFSLISLSDNPIHMSENPYAAPSTDATANAQFSNQEILRKKYISHEVSIKSIGILYWISGLLMSLSLFALSLNLQENGGSVVPVVSSIAISVFFIFVGIHIRKFKRWARIVAIILSVIGLIGFPIGTLISIYFLYLLCSKKGTVVFSEEYQDAIAATPEIKYKTSKVTWAILGLLIVGGVIFAVYAGKG